MLFVTLALVAPQAAGAATTRLDAHGTIRLDGRKVFPIVLAKGPERASTTPTGPARSRRSRRRASTS